MFCVNSELIVAWSDLIAPWSDYKVFFLRRMCTINKELWNKNISLLSNLRDVCAPETARLSNLHEHSIRITNKTILGTTNCNCNTHLQPYTGTTNLISSKNMTISDESQATFYYFYYFIFETRSNTKHFLYLNRIISLYMSWQMEKNSV